METIVKEKGRKADILELFIWGEGGRKGRRHK